MPSYDLDRFLEAQQGVYDGVLDELRRARKTGHWIWYIFPQIAGLGSSSTSRYYAIGSLAEARAYLAHPVLGARLRECAGAVLESRGRTATKIFGSVDAMKLRSSMTLFHRAAPDEPVFAEVLDRYFDGVADKATDTRLRAGDDRLASMPIRRLLSVDEAQIEGLADLLIDSIDAGASVGFMHPLAPAKAQAFWRRIAAAVAAGERALLVAEDDVGIVGTVQLVLAQPENQPHRADVSKMLVHRRARRLGLGAALMHAAETMARDCGKTLLVLDTWTGSDAERLYTRLGWVRVGTIPDYALLSPGRLGATTVFYKAL